jgi:putative heme-binding domain-containing protein
MEALAKETKAPEPERAEALSALVTLEPKGAVAVLGQVLGDATTPVGLRDRSAGALAAIDQPEARQKLIDVLPTAPDRLQTTIAVGLAARKPGAEALLEAIKAGKASARVLQEQRVVGPLNNAGIPDLKSRLAALLRGLPAADQRLHELLKRRATGFGSARHDLSIGAKVFEKNCANCHQIGDKGARVGPQLDGIGARGVDRLLEDTLDPSRNVDQAFRTTVASLKNGQVVTGLLLREEGAVLVFADAQAKEVRVPIEMVEDRIVTQLSPMPANFADQIPESDFYDLFAFLLAQAKEPLTK